MTALFGVLSYTFMHYKDFLMQETIIVIVCVISILSVLFVFVKLFLREINKLEKEKE
ncbi:hypothetical protein OQH61_03555 [Helicobacter sp. MIT 21-1697]|uniref:hypothetical protein n=1 Tax=Helicobacter sp. MIT 21-1697 TaxID=2993733 RepID=UPI00224B737A|nr:hypothetical protein [Helicobacter sp. MIT 21-1697]MCX2716810.1 hypothetical protein [Helicobacter sp. MIT 21-1697]